MKTKLLIIVLVGVTAFSFNGCKKKDTTPAAPTTGTVYFKNTQVDPYTIYLDGTNEGVLAAGATSSGYTVTIGVSHTTKASQYSGYILYPTVLNGTATVGGGASVIWSF